MGKTYAVVIGLVLTVVGIVGFVKGDGGSFMMLHFTTIHNCIHLASGLIGLAAGLGGGEKGGKGFAKVFGLVYTLVAILGFAKIQFVLNLFDHSATPDATSLLVYNVIHLGVGLLGLLAGFMGGSDSGS
jgi:hypothetical protein